MQTYGSIQKGISWHDTEHQISICKRHISEEFKREHSKDKTAIKRFCLGRQKKSYLWNARTTTWKTSYDKVTKTYKKAPPKLGTSINLEAKNMAELINLVNRIECIARTPAFITLKNNKPDFWQSPLCWLINPANNKLGKVSKLIMEKINEKLMF